jgi:pimeloyl-ACP methyl ester carboxylesterase
MIRSILAAFLVVLTTATPAYAGRSQGIEWKPCAEDATAECGTVRVPVDWTQPYGPSIELAVARRAATDPARRLGALVVNPGGPGGSGVDFAQSAESFFSKELRARFDIVGYDPRGVGRSHPVVCSEALVDAAPSPLLATAREYAAAIVYNRRLAADCAQRTGPLFDHVDTPSGVRDLEAVRAALGPDPLNFYGVSYGTLLGAEYAGRYPARVRAMVLDSVMDHSADVGDFLATEAGAAQDSFDEFVAWCARDARCTLRGRDIPAIWAGLLVRAAAGTLVDPYDPTVRLTVFKLLGVAFTSFYEPQWYSLAFYLKNAADGVPQARARRAAAGEIAHSFPAVFCADWALPVRDYPDFVARLRAMRERAPQMLVSPLALTATVGCLGRPLPAGPAQRPPAPAQSPILLVNARHDPATSYAWAQHVTAQLGPAATLLTYDGWGHITYGRSTCVIDAVDAYLVTVMPPTGTSCPGVTPDPFGIG